MLSLLNLDFAEETLAGVLALHEILPPASSVAGERPCGAWPVCSRLEGSMKGMQGIGSRSRSRGSLFRRDDMPAARGAGAWCDSAGLWRAWASVAAFGPVASGGEYAPVVKRGCAVLVGRGERLAKTAVGWGVWEVWRYVTYLVSDALDSTSDRSRERR